MEREVLKMAMVEQVSDVFVNSDSAPAQEKKIEPALNAGKEIKIGKGSYVNWEDFEKVYALVKANRFINNKCLKRHALLSLYYLMPVRGEEDYRLMIIVNTKKDAEKSNQCNYYVNETKGIFIFNKYKEAHIYQRQIFEVPAELDKIIKFYIRSCNITGSLLGYKRSNSIATALVNTFLSYLHVDDEAFMDDNFDIKKYKRISVRILRDAYINYLIRSGRLDTLEKRIMIQNAMAHKLEPSLEYFQNPEKKLVTNDEDKLIAELKIIMNNKDNLSLPGIYSKFWSIIIGSKVD
ncbi:MAG: hypothetical protein Hyperionvirus29_27 [Hyperionvirus sp.]|uniref:Uncharacterized protein n=1 Tax=Hyperionvirus sp. TaxID=2487770 RepID=A0A3G5AD78_9VIRU|nr:MAG: hypothetical protein Hyperionvirus29_27 [Hyperionvirus sp.]